MTPYYQDSWATIYHADCRDALPHLELSDLVVVTDPPYGVNLGEHKASREKRPRYLAKRGYLSYEDSRENFLAVVAPVVALCVEKAKRVAVFMAGSSMWDLPRADAVGGVFLPAGCGRNSWGFNSFAHCLFYGSAADLHLGARPTGIASGDVARFINHPCPKPLSWMRWAIKLCASLDDVILDPFMGSGTTLRAAKDMGIKSVGIEIEERYCEIAARRLRQDVLWPTMNACRQLELIENKSAP